MRNTKLVSSMLGCYKIWQRSGRAYVCSFYRHNLFTSGSSLKITRISMETTKDWMVYLLLQVKLGSFFLGCFRDLSEIPTLDILVHVNRQQLEISDFHEHSLLVILTPGIRNTVTTRGLIFFFSGTCLSTAAIHSLGQRFEELFFDVFPIPGTEKNRNWCLLVG